MLMHFYVNTENFRPSFEYKSTNKYRHKKIYKSSVKRYSNERSSTYRPYGITCDKNALNFLVFQ